MLITNEERNYLQRNHYAFMVTIIMMLTLSLFIISCMIEDQSVNLNIMDVQIVSISIGILFLLILQLFEDKFFTNIFSRFEPWLIAAVAIAIIPHFFDSVNGAKQDIRIGILSINSGVFTTVSLLVSFAIVTAQKSLPLFSKALIVSGSTIICLAVLHQPDFSIFLMLFFFTNYFLLLNKKKKTALILTVGGFSLFYLYLTYGSSGYRMQRFIDLWRIIDNGYSDPFLAREMFKVGGFFGQANDLSKYLSRPYAFMPAIASAHFGFFIMVTYFINLAIFFIIGLSASEICPNNYESLVLKTLLFLLSFFTIAGIAQSFNIIPFYFPIPFLGSGNITFISLAIAGLLIRSLRVNQHVDESDWCVLKSKPTIIYVACLSTFTIYMAYIILMQK